MNLNILYKNGILTFVNSRKDWHVARTAHRDFGNTFTIAAIHAKTTVYNANITFEKQWQIFNRELDHLLANNKYSFRMNEYNQQTHQRWCLVENESWAGVCLSTLFHHWQNNVETTLIELCWFNVDDQMLFQRSC